MAWTAYVAAFDSETLVPIDTATDTAGTPIAVGRYPAGVAITPDGRTAYVASYFNDALTPVDTAGGTAATPIAVASEDVAIAPDGRTAWVTDGEAVAPVAIPGGTISTPITVGKELRDLAVSPDGATVWVAVGQANEIVPVDIATGAVGTPLAAGPHPVALAITPDGKTAWVVDEEMSGEVTPVDLSAGTTGTPIPLGEFPDAIAITPDGRTAYVSDYGSGAVTPMDLATATAGAPIPVGESPEGIAIVPALPPVPSFTVGAATPGGPVAFDASASHDPGGTIASYHWDFGDGWGATTSGPLAGHAYAAPGDYRVTLSVDNGADCEGFLFTGHTAYCDAPPAASTTRTVTVPAPPSSPGSASPVPTHPSQAPRVRLHCPAHAGPHGCGFRVRAVAARPRRGSKRRPPALSAVAKARLAAGRSTVVTLRPKRAFVTRLDAARTILVAEKLTIRGRTGFTYRRLTVVGR
jgi:YVTN family beta-propeller protein